MFLAIDESFSGNFTALGCLCIDQSVFPDMEKQFIVGRMEEKVWGEIKWNKITRAYLGKYQRFVGDYLSEEAVTFHSWVYKNPTRAEISAHYKGDADSVIYKQAYLMIRSVIRKCINNGYRGSFYIVPDETGARGTLEYKTTADLLKADTGIFPKLTIEFCSQGNSLSSGAHQICDICTGATRRKYEKITSDPVGAGSMVNFLETINSGVSLNFSSPSLPNLDDFKLHHCLMIHR